MLITPEKAADLAKVIDRQGDELAADILASLYALMVETDNDDDLMAAVSDLRDEAVRIYDRSEEATRNGGAFTSYQHAAE
ncbi:hypothetical protein PXK01_19690 [Phaeobacter sp. PT47_59]|uniref:hypothetical protein n=1 Tax=Phaeobacter sp. PT47_59 TaxID=3029979 RepID=UPI00238073FE|nr:hypothetical protein [Phaeobacter sp. PT47_59]MDE4176385.1 hypothetical protein [Phaeobacter sp. PT47_59]